MKRNKRRQIVQVAVIVIAIFGTSALLIFPKPVNAFKEQLMQKFTNLGGNISVVLSNNSNHQSHPRGIMEKEVTAFQTDIPFKILIPKHIPEGFEFKSITKSSNNENALVILSFISTDAEFLFTQSKVSDNFSYSININENQGQSEQVQIGRHVGNMITFKDGSCSLTWLTDDNVLCEISGNVTSEQTREIADSI
ncbi:MAG: DUF4367 domain-containing protein [Bacillota bacterium]|nr:DUF4367 domain-containing protein [Bacillota bacterium]